MKGKKWIIPAALTAAVGIGAMFSPQIVPFVSANEDLPETVENAGSQAPCFGEGNVRMGQYFAGNNREILTETLQMTVEEWQEARLDGKTIADIASEKGVSEEELMDAMLKAKEDQLNQLVADGVITEEQKAYMLENMKERVAETIRTGTVGWMKNGTKGKGMKGGFGEEGENFRQRGFRGGQ